ncbi:MAG: hypothetical protein JSS87_13220 [Acidobacteria bacterium]|nr:hypothetical protein [Acidobacteriota bacterium]
MKRLLILALLSCGTISAQNAPVASASPQSTDLAAEAVQLADIAQHVCEEIDRMKKFELSVKALRGAAEAEALARRMRSQAGTASQH